MHPDIDTSDTHQAGLRTVGVVLAGGRSRRMGTAKALVPFGGAPMLDHVIRALRSAGLETVVVAKPGSVLPSLDVPVWHDDDQVVHPLAGVVTALRRAAGPIVVVACDMPFVTAAAVRRLADHPASGAVLASSNDGRSQPLLGRYVAADLRILERALVAQRPMREVADSIHPVLVPAHELDPVGGSLLAGNLNTPRDLAQARRRLRIAQEAP